MRRHAPDIAALAGLLLLNPLVYAVGKTSAIMTPDVIAYVTFARELVDSGRLFLSSWGHVDTGLVLPPLYPLLLGLTASTGIEVAQRAEAISTICLIAAILPFYLIARRLAGPATAFAAVMLVQVNFHYAFYGSTPLTEAMFVLLLSTCLLLALRLAQATEPRYRLAMTVGLVAGLVFLSRQAGFILILFLLAWHVAAVWRPRELPRPVLLRRGALVGAGFLVVFVPYAALLYAQTGQMPLVQAFRMNQYVVAVSEPELVARIQRIKDIEESTYEDIYVKRRLLTGLLPDASEMLGNTITATGGPAHSPVGTGGPAATALGAFLRPAQLLRNLAGNLRLLHSVLGTVVFAALMLSLVTLVVVRERRSTLRLRLLLPSFIFCYLLIISAFGDKVARYVEILVPLVLIHTASEMMLALRALPDRWLTPRVRWIAAGAVFLALLIATPRFFFEMPLRQRVKYDYRPLTELSADVQPGDAVFSITPLFSHLVGGKFRQLPNDTLEKTVVYAQRTGVKWIVVPVPKTLNDHREISFYTEAPWLSAPVGLDDYRSLVRYRGTIPKLLSLYEVSPSETTRTHYDKVQLNRR